MGDNESRVRICTVCAEPIRLEARKCVHCGSYQNWWERLNLSVTAMSALTALISVFALTAPIIADALTPDEARFNFSEPEFAEGLVTVEAKNVGGAPATVDWAAIFIPQKSAGQPYIYPLSARGSGTDHRVQPGETKRLTFEFDTRQYDPPPVTEADRGCLIEVFDLKREVSCDEVRFVGRKPAHQSDRAGELPEEGPAPLPDRVDWRRN